MSSRGLPSGWVSVSDAARMLGVSRMTLYKWRDAGVGPKASHYGLRPAYRFDEVRDYMRQGEAREAGSAVVNPTLIDLTGDGDGITVMECSGDLRIIVGSGTLTPVSFVLRPAAALDLAEALEKIARPFISGGDDDFVRATETVGKPTECAEEID